MMTFHIDTTIEVDTLVLRLSTIETDGKFQTCLFSVPRRDSSVVDSYTSKMDAIDGHTSSIEQVLNGTLVLVPYVSVDDDDGDDDGNDGDDWSQITDQMERKALQASRGFGRSREGLIKNGLRSMRRSTI